MRVAAYARVSTTRQAQAQGIEEQLDLWVPKTHATWAYAPRMPLGQCPRVAVGGGFARRAVVR